MSARKRVDEGDLGWMSGTRATLRNAGTPINQTPTEAQVSRRTKKTTGRAAPEGNDVSGAKPSLSDDGEERPETSRGGGFIPQAPKAGGPGEVEEIVTKYPPNDLYVGGFGSHHPSGAGFLFGDGAVKFLTQDIDKEIFQHLAHRADGQLLTAGPTRE